MRMRNSVRGRFVATALILGLIPITARRQQAQPNAVMRPFFLKSSRVVAGVHLTARAKQEVVSPTQSAVVQVDIKNTSKKERSFLRSEVAFELVVQNEYGQTMPETRYAFNLFVNSTINVSPPIMSMNRKDWDAQRVAFRLKPGEEKTIEFIANRLYDMTESGPYFITVRQRRNDEKNQKVAASNTVKLEVREPAPATNSAVRNPQTDPNKGWTEQVY